MRRKLAMVRGGMLAVGLLLALSTTLFGQVRGGIKGGYNSSNVSLKLDDEKVDTKSKGGFHVGGLLSFSLSPTAALQVEGLYTKKGFKLDPESVIPFNTEWRFTYWEFPVLAMFTTPLAVTSPRIFFGPTFSFLTSCKRKVFEDNREVELDCLPGETKTTDFGFMAGAGVKATSLTIDLAYEWGFKDIREDEQVSLKNRNLTFSVGLTFPN